MYFSKSFFAAAALFGMANAFNGDATYFQPGLGACGGNNNANDLIVALSSPKYGNGSNCGRNIKINYKGKSVTVKVVDKCPGCKTDDIDLSPAAFQRLAPLPAGRIQVTWNYV